MSNTLKELEELKRKLEALERERMKVEGMQAQLLEQLKAHGLDSYEAAITEHARLVEARAADEAKAAVIVQETKAKYELFL